MDADNKKNKRQNPFAGLCDAEGDSALSALLDTAELGILLLDGDLKIRFLSQQISNIYKISPEDVGEEFFKISSKVPQDDSIEVATLALKSGKKIKD